MRTYTEEEVLKIVEYACGMQKAEDYQWVANILDSTGNSMTQNGKVLDYLYDTDKNYHKTITIKDINEHLDDE